LTAPRALIDLLESVVGIYLSGIRHRERAAFILCDEFVEMACKLKAKEYNYRFDMRCSFHQAWNAEGVGLDANLGRCIQQSRDTRNNMQHNNAAAAVDDQHCADAIMDAVAVLIRCWPADYDQVFQPWLKCALRIVKAYSSTGDVMFRQYFEEAMRDEAWRSERRFPKVSETIILPGRRQYWGILVRESATLVDQLLNRIESNLAAGGGAE
jgi:hypothetical protein